MDYKTMRDRIEDMAKDNHKDFVKAVISMEKGINDESALDKLYEAYMDNDSLNLLHEEFDYMIEDLREQGQIKDLPYVQEEKDNLVNIVGNFVKLFGQLRTSIDDNGKEHSNVRIFSSKLLKAKEQMKEQDKSQEIAKLKSEIEEREKDLFFADSWEQLGQIRADVEEMKAKLNTLTGSEKGILGAIKKSILGAIKEYQAEDKENNVDDKGNFYDPLSKDTDNDGIPDRYDNAFQDSDYFESTYDVEDNLHTKEESTQKTGDKPSILGQIRAYQEESKTEEKQTTKEQDKSQEIAKLKSEIEEREKDLFYADSWEQLGQIRADIEEMKAKLNTLTGSEKGKENDKKSILGAIKEYQAEDKENNVDDKGNFYDPLSKDTDNDGIPDRYDNAFQDSDYFESTYDVEDNLHAKEEQEKPSISAQIQKYQQEEKANERRQCISEERNDELSR